MLIIDENNTTKLLKRKYPYSDDRNKSSYFWEKIQVPRGCLKHKHECLLFCALREFYEETGCLLQGKCHLYNRPFILSWTSNNTLYEYAVFIIIIKNFNINVKIDNNYKLLDVDVVEINDDANSVVLKKNEKKMKYNFKFKSHHDRKGILYELLELYPVNMPLRKYFYIMKNILKENSKDVPNNYDLFFDFIRRVKYMYTYHAFYFTTLYFSDVT